MSNHNPNFPQRPSGPEIGATAQQNQWGQPQMPTVGAATQPGGMNPMNPMSPMGNGGRQMSPLDQVQAMLRSGQFKNKFEYEERKSPTNMDYSAVDEFMNGGSGGEASAQQLLDMRREEAKNAVAPMIVHICSDFMMQKQRFRELETVTKQFSAKFTGGYPVKVVEKFWTMICNNTQIRQTIGVNVGTVFAHQMASGLMYDQAPTPQQSASIFHGCIDNILAMELGRWLTASPTGRILLNEDGDAGKVFRRRLMEQILEKSPHISASFSFMDIPSPYEGFEPSFEETMDMASSPLTYAVHAANLQAPQPYGAAPTAYTSITQDLNAQTPASDMLDRVNAQINEQRRREQEQAYRDQGMGNSYYMGEQVHNEPEPHHNLWEDNSLSFGEVQHSYTNWDEMNSFNKDNYKWREELVNIPGTNLFTAANEVVRGIHRAFFNGYYAKLRSGAGTITVFSLDEFGNPNADDRRLPLKGRPVETFLTNPELLLPLLAETEDGIIEVREVEVPVDEDQQYDLTPVRKAACADDRIRTTMIDEIAFSDLEAQDREVAIVHTAGRRNDIPHATSNVEVHYETLLMDTPARVSDVYRSLSMLTKSNKQATNYFDFVKGVYHTLTQNFIQDGPLLEKVDFYLKNELERHMIERYGFSNDPESNEHFSLDTLTDCYQDLPKRIESICPEAAYELSNFVTSQTLINKSQCFVPRKEALDILTANIRPNSRVRKLEEYDAAMRVMFVREVVVTRISNMVPPVQSASDTVSIVKRSEHPNLFKIIEVTYGQAAAKVHAGAEQFIVFSDVSDKRWTFQTNRYDGQNVGTLRTMKFGGSTTMMELAATTLG